MKIFLSAGENSGDLHGASLSREIKKISPSTELFGFGGEEMQAAGVRLVRNYRDYNVMGIAEVVKNLRRILKLLDDLTEIIREEKPDLLVLIDYPDFNWRLARRVKKFGIKILSYIPPSAWAWRKGRAKSCAKIADEFIAIFPFELPVYEQAGAKISFLGNPLVDTVKTNLSVEDARKFFNVERTDHIIILSKAGNKITFAGNVENGGNFSDATTCQIFFARCGRRGRGGNFAASRGDESRNNFDEKKSL